MKGFVKCVMLAVAILSIALLASAQSTHTMIGTFQAAMPVADAGGLAAMGSGMIILAVFLRKLRRGSE